MVFSSMVFLFAFLPIVLFAYYVLPSVLRNPFLLIADLVFYGWGEPVYVLVMLFVTLVNYVCGLFIGKYRSENPGVAKLSLAIAAVISVGTLCVFKYSAFFVGILNALPFGLNLAIPQIELPIGISFYTFQTVSYCIDVYRADTEQQRDPIKFGVYVTLFPQLIAGPIVRYKDVADQLDGHRAGTSQFARGVTQFIVGLGKKVLIANQMGLLWDMLRPGVQTNGIVAAWAGIVAYTLQIYFDFSGYSDMACGLGNMLGLTFMRNFDYPYISKSITEFWRRWHISLSTWFRDYIYIPLGGNRCGRGRHLFNLFTVWFLTGLWHGASWNFVLWGLYYFVILLIEKTFLKKRLEKLPSFIVHIYTLVLVMFGWVLFYFDSGISDCFAYIAAMFSTGNGIISQDALNIVLRYLPIVLVACICSTPLGANIRERVKDKCFGAIAEIVFCACVFILCVAALASQSYNPFLYFKF